MSTYIIRVELHREPDYQKLHEAMRARGFKRTITAHDGTVYKLPTGMYSAENTTSSRDTVHNVANAAAVSIGHNNAAILVVESSGCTWSGLERATDHEIRLGA